MGEEKKIEGAEGVGGKPGKAGVEESQLSESIARTRAQMGGVEAGGVKEPHEGFVRLTPRLGQLLQAFQARTEGAMQAFRLPGTNRVIHDNRGEEQKADDKAKRPHDHKQARNAPERGDGAAEEVKREVRIRDGKAEEVKEKTYENYLALRQMTLAERPQELKLKERQLSEFEKLLVERFEQAKKVEEASKEGKTSFLAKTVEQWRSFFEKFLHRTIRKSADLGEIQEFLFRGMVRKGDAKAVLISDIIHNGGHTDKFARFAVLYHKIGNFLSGLLPGDTVARNKMAEGLSSERLLYLALTPPSAETEIMTGMKPSQGMFMSEAAEAKVAEDLGIAVGRGGVENLRGHIAARGRKRKKGGLFGWFSVDEDIPDERQERFMPWWQWGGLKRPGGFTLKRALYSGLFIIFILTILFLVHQYLLGK